MAKFDNAKVGDNVWSSKKGWGKITKIDKSKVYDLLEVTFLISSNEDIEKITYTFDGRESLLDLYPTLFWNEVELPTDEEDKKPFDLVAFLRENLEPEEFIVGEENIAFIYNYANNTWEIGIYNFTHIETTYISKISEKDYLFNDILDVLIENQVTPQQLKQAYKILNWL